jgi:hypothetical protein
LNILLTGAAGHIGGKLRRLFAGRFAMLRVSDVAAITDLGPGEENFTCDLADKAVVERAMDGIDGVIHLGALSVEYDFDRILAANITGEALTANLLRNKSSHSAVDIGHHDLSASGCKLNAQGFTNTIGTSCNNYRFSRQSHQSSPIYFMPQFRSKLYD